MLKNAPLGKKTGYVQTYAPDLLYPVPRSFARDKLNMKQPPFHGFDIWNGYELSFLNKKGKPVVALVEFIFPCNSENIVESKSLKLYLNSFNGSNFDTLDEVKKIIEKDISKTIKTEFEINLYPVSQLKGKSLYEFEGICLDDLDIETGEYEANPKLLRCQNEMAEESLYSNLLKSNCMATGQPDFGSLLIRYKGPKIDHSSLLKYIISYRNHIGFAEHCVEQMFMDLLNQCGVEKLTVYARYTRRGGLDINPFRSNFESRINNLRHIRQ